MLTHATLAVAGYSNHMVSDRLPRKVAMLWLAVIITSAVVATLASEPAQWDWREKGVAPPVADQGQTGEVYMYAILGAIESSNAIQTGKLVQLSIGELIDC